MDRWLERYAEVCFRRSADTAHDLKTPLNIAVLNLELLRMRAKRLSGGDDDEKILSYSKAVEEELRKLARIFDAFFVYSVPPRGDHAVERVDVGAVLTDVSEHFRLPMEPAVPPFVVLASPQRVRDLFRLFIEGAVKIFGTGNAVLQKNVTGAEFRLAFQGRVADDRTELEKVFKFYFNGPDGTPEISLATARLIAETLGGTVSIISGDGLISLELVLPAGEE